MDKHVEPRIENDLLRIAVDVTGEAKLERKRIGNMRGLRKVVTIKDKSYLYNPKRISKVLKSSTNCLKQINIKKLKKLEE